MCQIMITLSITSLKDLSQCYSNAGGRLTSESGFLLLSGLEKGFFRRKLESFQSCFSFIALWNTFQGGGNKLKQNIFANPVASVCAQNLHNNIKNARKKLEKSLSLHWFLRNVEQKLLFNELK